MIPKNTCMDVPHFMYIYVHSGKKLRGEGKNSGENKRYNNKGSLITLNNNVCQNGYVNPECTCKKSSDTFIAQNL